VYANVGLTLNARALEHAIRKMLSHPLREVRDIGGEVRTVAQGEVPTLVRYAEASPFLRRQGAFASTPESAGSLSSVQAELSGPAGGVFLRHAEPQSEVRALAAAAVRGRGISYAEALGEMEASPDAAREAAQALLAGRGEWDNAPRELEHITYTAEVLADQGAYFEAKRHRMLSLTSAPLTTRLGYTTPRWFAEAGLLESYRRAMDSAREAFEHVAREDPLVAGYVVPNGYLRRFLMTLNMREAFHLCELRARPNAHFAMRVVALHLAELVRGVHPLRCAMRLEGLPEWRVVEQENFLSS
jgi:hypothetical protein